MRPTRAPCPPPGGTPSAKGSCASCCRKRSWWADQSNTHTPRPSTLAINNGSPPRPAAEKRWQTSAPTTSGAPTVAPSHRISWSVGMPSSQARRSSCGESQVWNASTNQPRPSEAILFPRGVPSTDRQAPVLRSSAPSSRVASVPSPMSVRSCTRAPHCSTSGAGVEHINTALRFAARDQRARPDRLDRRTASKCSPPHASYLEGMRGGQRTHVPIDPVSLGAICERRCSPQCM